MRFLMIAMIAVAATTFVAAPASADPCVLFNEDDVSIDTRPRGHSIGVCFQPIQLHCGYLLEGVVGVVWNTPVTTGLGNVCYEPI